MFEGNPKALGLALWLVLAALTLAACGSGNGPVTATAPAVTKATAEHLAKLSDRIATDLDSGETCSAAMAADDLQSALHGADLSASLRPGVDAVVTRLVNEVNCPPPPPPPPAPQNKDHKHNEGDHQDKGPKPPGHGGKLPPGQAKLKGEG